MVHSLISLRKASHGLLHSLSCLMCCFKFPRTQIQLPPAAPIVVVIVADATVLESFGNKVQCICKHMKRVRGPRIAQKLWNVVGF